MREPHKIVVVTGASLGLGSALARGFAAEGLRVAGISRNIETLREAIAGHDITPIAADVSRPADVADAFDEIRETLGDPDILINNAAVYPHRDVLEETPESFMATMAINLGGPFACCHEVLPAMVEKGHGRIINVATFADVRPAPLSVSYSVSKGASRILTRALLADLSDRFPGILINDWVPGALKTRMGLIDGIEPDDAARWGVKLAMMEDRALNGLVFDRNCEYRPTRGLKDKLKARLLGQNRPLITLD